MVSPMLFLGKSSLRATTKSPCYLLQIPLYLAGWMFTVAFELLQCADYLMTCWPVSQSFLVSLRLLCLSCLWVHLPCLLQHMWRNIIQPLCSEDSACRRKSFVLCYHSSFPWASSFKLGSLYRTLRSSTQNFFLFCVGNVLGMRSRGMFSLLIGKYVFTWIRQEVYLYTLQSCAITTGEITES